MSKGWPADCAKTSAGCGEVVARSATTRGRLPGQLLRQQLDEVQVAVGEGAYDQLASIVVSGVSASSAAACAAASSSCDCSRLLAERADFVERLAGLLRHVVDVGGEEGGGFGERGEVAAGGGYGALSGDEFDAPSLADFFGLAQQDAADLSGLVDVRAAAGAEIEVVDVDEAQFVAVGEREVCAGPASLLLRGSRSGCRPGDSPG